MTNTLILIGLLFFLSSCATKHSQGREISAGILFKKGDIAHEIEQAQSLHDLGEVDAAIVNLRMVVDKTAYHPSHDQAYELIVEWLLQLKKKAEAQRIASYFMSNHQKSPSVHKIIDLFNQAPNDEPPAEKTESEDPDFLLDEEQPTEDLSEELLDLENSVSQQNDEEIKNALQTVDMRALGVMLPLTGTYASFGQKTLKAMSIALGIKMEPSDENINVFIKDDMRIVVADSKGDAKVSEQMLYELIKKHHIAMLVGDIINEPSLKLAQLCERYQLPLLTLSRPKDVVSLGDHVFMFNSSPTQQILSLVEHAINAKGHKRFALLYPRHHYGKTMSKIFYDTVVKMGGAVTAIEAYDAKEDAFFDPIKKLVGKYHLHARKEYVECVKNSDAKSCEASLKPVVDFDALFVPEFNKIAFIVPALRQQDILLTNSAAALKSYALATKIDHPHAVQLLGPSSFNDSKTLSKLGNQIDGAYFIDSVSFDSSDQVKTFSEKFMEMTTQAPTSLEVFAHDALKLAWSSLKKMQAQPDASRIKLRSEIAQFHGRVGLLEDFSFTKEGELNAVQYGFEINSGTAHASELRANKSL